MDAEDILSDVQLIDLTHRDAQFVRAELTEKINAAIAQAMQAERAHCIETALDCFFDLTDTSTMSALDVIKRTRHGIAAAIRARSAQEGSEMQTICKNCGHGITTAGLCSPVSAGPRFG